MNDVRYCWAVCYDEIGGFWPCKKAYEPSDKKHLGKIVFFDEEKAKETARIMNGE